MPPDSLKVPKVLKLYLEITQYPILAPKIRARMREELFTRGVITRTNFETEVRTKAEQTQRLEGLDNPLIQEPADVWERRKQQTRDYLTDFYFAYNLPHELFEGIVQSIVAERNPSQKVFLTFNPELAPIDMVLAQGERYEALPQSERAQAQHHIQEMVVVVLKTLMTDHLGFIRIAKEWFTIHDLKEIRQRRIGDGKIGGKAAGMLLAWKILQRVAEQSGAHAPAIVLPNSWYIGSSMLYEFNSHNNLLFSVDQKYKPLEQIEAEYPSIVKAYLESRLPEEMSEPLRELLAQVGKRALIVRSSSLLEDNFGTSFAGKYDSFFCPNQGTFEQNFAALATAIKRTYASALNPDALAYRKRMRLIDYDERMAILIQEVQGERRGRYLFPTLAGVAYSRNPFRWNPQIRREDGFVRLVWGLGTRAVERVGADFPRMVALSHPRLRPEVGADELRKHSQRFIDLIDLENNILTTSPIASIFSTDDKALPYLVSVDKGDYVQSLFADPLLEGAENLLLTFDGLLQKTDFVTVMKTLLQRLEREYAFPVDVEFTADILQNSDKPRVRVHILQCRPHTSYETGTRIELPANIPETDQVFSTNRLVPQGLVQRIRYIVYVHPEKYSQLGDPTLKLELARVIGRLNQRLEGQTFILMGPGRWGSANMDLGLKVGYADINNTRVLVEIALPRGEGIPDVSYGTHFFQDLVEAHIYPLPLFPHEPGTSFNRAFFTQAPNVLAPLLPGDAAYAEYIKVIEVPTVANGRHLEIVMDEERGEAVAYLRRYEGHG
ncbi:MAG: PEP/pyruvate-binding domain-containing protein [Chloroflexi bacterium]|nr:PEP/pyruvate-binding domain-containing protein [Chloroflexota bacterium]